LTELRKGFLVQVDDDRNRGDVAVRSGPEQGVVEPIVQEAEEGGLVEVEKCDQGSENDPPDEERLALLSGSCPDCLVSRRRGQSSRLFWWPSSLCVSPVVGKGILTVWPRLDPLPVGPWGPGMGRAGLPYGHFNPAVPGFCNLVLSGNQRVVLAM
jgi:hypothetical protein